MSRKETLREQNKKYSTSLIEAIEMFGYDNKYNELFIRLIKNYYKSSNYIRVEIYKMFEELGIPTQKLDSMDNVQLTILSNIFIKEFGYDKLKIFNEFVSKFDKVNNRDLSTYNTVEDIEKQLSILEIKNISKELENQVIKLYEDDDFLIVKPLTWEASKKYGANTKWCTASKYDFDQYKNYSQSGILIYSINKITGDKFAVFKRISHEYEKELSFWNSSDRRVDSIELNVSSKIMDVIRNEIFNCDKTNYESSNEEVRKKIELEYEKYYGTFHKTSIAGECIITEDIGGGAEVARPYQEVVHNTYDGPLTIVR